MEMSLEFKKFRQKPKKKKDNKKFDAAKASLKLSIVKFLDTECNLKRCAREHFWNHLSNYTQRIISHKDYGVPKMSNILSEFHDVLYCDDHFVYLRLQNATDAIILSSDSESLDGDHLSNTSSMPTTSKSMAKTPSSRKNTTPWGAGAKSTSKVMEISDESENEAEEKQSKTPSNSGFIAFSDNSVASRERQGQLSHKRYGLQQQQSQTMSAENSSQGTSQFMNSHQTVQAMAQSFMSQFEASRTDSGLTPQTSRMARGTGALGPVPSQQFRQQQMPQASGMSNAMNPGMGVMGPSPSQHLGQQQMHSNRMSATLPTDMTLPPSGVMVPPPQPVPSEWPQQRPRTGPPPGTKITDILPEPVPQPIRLPPGTRLTSQQVNLEIETCRQLLADAGEHVSLERVESFVLEKFQVPDFRRLNLKERYFDNLPAGRDLSMLLGKVNSYIQNFVRSRSICTLYELGECCREFHQDKKSFEHLQLGPLQKMPIVYDLFKFPYDEYIPEITTVDLMEHLNVFLTKYQKWTTRVNVSEFMTYLCEEAFKIESGFSLGVRLRSLPLAIQTMKKAQRDSAATRRNLMESLREVFTRDVQQAFAQFRASLLQTSEEGKHELRLHYMNLTPEVAIRELFAKFELLSYIFSSDNSMQRKIERLNKAFQSFVSVVLDVPIPRMLYHLSVCLSNLEVQESATDFMQQERAHQQQQEEARQAVQQQRQQQQKATPTKAKLVEKTLGYLNKCLESGNQLQLSYLQTIEAKLLEDFQFESFSQMGYGRFLELIQKEPKLTALLEECGGTMLGSSSKGHHNESLYKPSLSEVQELLCQANHAGLTQPQEMQSVLCEQYQVTEIRQLGHGSNIARLWKSAQTSRKHSSREQNVHYEAALCGKFGKATFSQHGHVGILGSQTREAAEACLTLCPLLEDLAAWSQWGLVFQPQFGPLRLFVEKYGGQKTITLKGKPGVTATSDFMALEVEPGKLLKICTFSGPEQFESALKKEDPRLAAGYLVSLVVANKGVEGAPLALLANHMKTALLSLHARSSGFPTPGGPPSLDSQKNLDLAVKFVTQMLMDIPLRICVAIAEQVLLKPLSEAVGSDKSKAQVLLVCQTRPQDLQRVEQLGCLLGISEWYHSSLQTKMEFPREYCVTEMLPADEDLFGSVTDEEEEEENEEDADSEVSDEERNIEDILDEDDSSGETDNEVESNEKPPSSVEDREAVDSGLVVDDTNNSNYASTKDEVDDSSSDDEDEESDDDEENDEDGEKSCSDSPENSDVTNEECEKDKDDDENVDKVGEAMKKILAVSTKEKEPTREEFCQDIVNGIRKEEFGVGIELGETEQKLMKKQQERQGRSLQRLSKDLYSKDTHFVLELIQNADDNSYPPNVVPAVKFLIDHTSVKVMNNESGFEAKNIQALCDVGKSTKTKHTLGYIGQKGIGFKSVFRVTGRPEVHSNGFHICFDVDSGPMGYILPHWIKAPEVTGDASTDTKSWQTLISLPWTEEIKQQLHTHAARFNDIKPSLLLFLHRLREITIDNRVDGVTTSMRRKDLGDGEVQISHSGITDRWLVVRKVLDASKVSAQMKAGVEVDSTEIALAFPLRGKNKSAPTKPKMLPVFAFLPLRTYGFRFIIQGDFDVPSSREDVDRDSSWNQWLRNEIHSLFIEALEAFKKRPDLTPLEALIQYLQFVPLEDEVVDFFKPVTTRILTQLRASKCLPVLSADKKGVSWMLPSQCVLLRDSLMQEVVSPELLKHRLGLHYLHPDVSNVLDQPLADVLRVQALNTGHLLDIGGFISHNWSGEGNPDQVMEIAKWLACVYRSLDDFQENTEVIEQLNKMRVIPLADGTLVALAEVTVFLLMENTGPVSKQNTSNVSRTRDPLKELKKDLRLVHSALTSTPDAEINSQVVKLLKRTGAVKQLTALDLIHSHIMPVLNSDLWESKSREVIISYLVYIKTELERQSSLLEISELKAAVRIATNHGILSPQESSIHFSTAFGNKINLQSSFPGVEWTLVDAAYLPANPTNLEKQSWHNFLTELGVVDFLRVKPVQIQFDKSNIHETPWAVYKDLWPDSPDGYSVTDYECKEFYQLVSTATTADYPQDRAIREMAKLFELLDAQWSNCYSKFAPTQLHSGSGHILKEAIETSFARHLKALSWIPAEWAVVTSDNDGTTATVENKRDLCRSSDIFVDCPVVRKRLAHTVKYLGVSPQPNSGLTSFLGIRDNISPTEAKEVFLSWCKRHPDKPNIPATFCTTQTHIMEIYTMIGDELSGKAAQDVFHLHPAIFVPVLKSGDSAWARGQFLVGKMMAREEVWWHDPTELFKKYRESLLNYNSPLGTRSILVQFYSRMEKLFQTIVRPEWEPTTMQLAQLLKHIASAKTLFDEGALMDCLCLFSHIGTRLAKIGEKCAGVPSYESSRQEAELQPVLALLGEAAVFPSHHNEWVNPGQQLLLLPDFPQLEEMFRPKPGVHFLVTDLPKSLSTKKLWVDKKAIQHFVGLFDSIKSLRDSVAIEEITYGFKQCISGQTYLHRVIGLIQRFLYFIFPEVYTKVSPGQAEILKELKFVEVERLEARYTLEGHPEIFEIKEEKCIVIGKMFYFHRAYISSQAEINREIAKYFSDGNNNCLRELMSFLTQAVPILEGKSHEPMESLLSRQQRAIRELPPEEKVWEVDLPIIQEPEPEPEPEPQEEPQMVYGRGLDSGVWDNIPVKSGSGDDAQDQEEGLKSWPPRSAVNINENQQRPKKDSEKKETPAGMWPPPRPPTSGRSAKTIPSNTPRAEGEASQDDGDQEHKKSAGQHESRRSEEGRESFSRQTSSESSSHQQQRSHEGNRADSKERPAKEESSRSTGDRPKERSNEGIQEGFTSRQNSDPEDPSSGEKQSLSACKRKASESLREGEPALTKKFNSQVDEVLGREQEGLPRDEGSGRSGSGTQSGPPGGKGHDLSHSEHDDTSSSMEVTPSSSGTSQDSSHRPSRDRRRIQFTIPIWSQSNQDLEYTDLSKAISSSLPTLDLQDVEHDHTEDNSKIGRWGEMLVLDYLLRLKDSDPQIEAVLWANAEGEKGLPWDFEMIYFGMEGSVYIEVKTTITQDREVFEVSPRQLELALKEGSKFEVYRVFGAGKNEPRLLRIENVAERMHTKQLKLFMLL